MSHIRTILIALLLGVFLILGVSVYVYLQSDREADSLVGQQYRELRLPTGFFNTDEQAITIGEHLGRRVVLLEFMRYGCPNCQQSFPHLTSLHDTYRDRGLTVIGIHTPQFPYEGERDNVEKALNAAGIRFPVVLDNNYGTWEAYENSYWPRTIIIDRGGMIVYDALGSIEKESVEKVLETLLSV
jgi:peroxiredoxin